MSSDASVTKTMYADPEHGGIRVTVILVMAVGYILSFFLLRLLLDAIAAGSGLQDFATAISCLFAFPLALGAGYLVERTLKRSWTSGLKFELTDGALHFEGAELADGSSDPLTLDWNKRVNITRWYSRLANYPKAGRERLVSDKWMCVACQMQQDDTRLIVYTFAPPEQVQTWLDTYALDEPFYQISLAYLYRTAGTRRWGATTRPEVPSEYLTGVDGRYWIAERRRWTEGLELAPDDFADLMAYIEQQSMSDAQG